MNENLVQIYAQTLPIHQGLMHALSLCVLIYIFLASFGLNSKNYTLKIRYFLPLYHSILAMMIFSGLLLLSAYNFKVNFHIFLMILTSLGLIASSAIGYKRLKFFSRIRNFQSFRKFAFKKTIFDVILILMAGI
ncbi:MAG: hypothetical protein K5978_08245 [Campylobacter sp.]|nr:hypothetical protein [Campylobacter sp.]